MGKKEKIMNEVYSALGEKGVKLVVHYGNKEGADVDVFVIIEGGRPYVCVKRREFDITCIGLGYLGKMVRGLDPLLTEPILTGETIKGSKEKLAEEIKETPLSRETVLYLANEAKKFHSWARKWVSRVKLFEACDCLRFSASFLDFAEYYIEQKEVTTFSELVSQGKCGLACKIKKTTENESATFNDVISLVGDNFKKQEKFRARLTQKRAV